MHHQNKPSFGLRLLFLMSTIACGQEQIIEKIENLPPQILITSHTNESVLVEGFEAEFRASVSDDDNEFNDLLVRWTKSGEIQCDWTPVSTMGESFCPFALTPSTNQIIAEVKDPQGAAGVSEILPTVRSNLPPTAGILAPVDGDSYYANDPVAFTLEISDAEEPADNITVVIDSTVDGILFEGNPDSNGQIAEQRYLSPGQHILGFTITDSGGANVSRSLNVLVKPDNEPPTCAFLTPAPDTNVLGGTAIDFVMQVDDINIPNDTIDAKLTSSIDGFIPIPSPSATGEIQYRMENFSLGRHTLTLTARDERGLECSTSQLLVMDSVPVVSIQTPSDGSVFSIGEIVEFQGRVLDNEDLEHEMILEWSSNVDGQFHSDFVNAQGRQQVFYDLLSVGPHTITASSTDSGGHSSSASIEVRINTPPTAPSVSFQPSVVYSNQDLIAVPVGASDIDNDTLTYIYEWSKNGVLQPNSTDTIPLTELNVGDTWTATITSDDGYDVGGSGTGNITVSNTEPTFSTGISLSNSTPEAGDTIACTAEAFDVDDGTLNVSYTWNLNGAQISTNDTLTIPLTAVVNDLYTCTVEATDANGTTISDSQSVNVANTPPEVTEPIISSNHGQFFVSSTLTCTSTVIDPNESLSSSHTWIINGSVLQTGSTIDLAAYTIFPGDTVFCQADTVDAEGATATSTNSVTLCAFSTCDESVHLNNGIGIDFVTIPQGNFMMGSSPNEPGRDADENQFPVELTNEYSVSTTEISQEMYEALMGNIWTAGQNTLSGEGPTHPVAYLSWHMAADYTNALTQHYNQSNGTSLSNCYSCMDSGTSSASCITLGNPYQCTGFRLPTEAEWEYAAKAGSTSTFWTTSGGGNLPNAHMDSCTIGWSLDDGSPLGDYAWYCGRNIVDESKAIGQNLANGFNLYDMHGNVWEWCHDGYSAYYPTTATTNYVQVSPGAGRVLRGGSWQDTPQELRIGNRNSQPPLYRMANVGLRVVRSN